MAQFLAEARFHRAAGVAQASTNVLRPVRAPREEGLPPSVHYGELRQIVDVQPAQPLGNRRLNLVPARRSDRLSGQILHFRYQLGMTAY
jgi:hypothetical protein